MTTAMSLGLLFIAKMADNALSTVKTIMIQRNRSLLAGVAIALSSFLYFWITRSVVLADSMLTTLAFDQNETSRRTADFSDTAHMQPNMP